MSKVRVTSKGKAAMSPGIKLTRINIELKDGTFSTSWTMDATYDGNRPIDNEGWALWGMTTVAAAMDAGYITLVKE